MLVTVSVVPTTTGRTVSPPVGDSVSGSPPSPSPPFPEQAARRSAPVTASAAAVVDLRPRIVFPDVCVRFVSGAGGCDVRHAPATSEATSTGCVTVAVCAADSPRRSAQGVEGGELRRGTPGGQRLRDEPAGDRAERDPPHAVPAGDVHPT